LNAKGIAMELFFASQGKKSGNGEPDPQGFAQRKILEEFYLEKNYILTMRCDKVVRKIYMSVTLGLARHLNCLYLRFLKERNEQQRSHLRTSH
jgi:hypothetical protein